MDYKDLLTRCKDHPGWMGSSSQRKVDSAIRYSNWVKNMDKTATQKKSKKHK